MVSFLIPNNGASIVRSRLPWMHAITVIFGHHNSHHLHLLKTHGFPLNNNTNIHKPLLLHCSGHHHPVSLPSTFGPLWHEFVSSHQTPSHTPHTFPNLYPQPYPSPTINPINLPKTLANPIGPSFFPLYPYVHTFPSLLSSLLIPQIDPYTSIVQNLSPSQVFTIQNTSLTSSPSPPLTKPYIFPPLWCNPTPQGHWIKDSKKIGPEMQEKALGFSWALG